MRAKDYHWGKVNVALMHFYYQRVPQNTWGVILTLPAALLFFPVSPDFQARSTVIFYSKIYFGSIRSKLVLPLILIDFRCIT